MTAEQKRRIKSGWQSIVTNGTFALCALILWRLFSADMVLQNAVTVADVHQWAVQSERDSTNGLRFANFAAMWHANHEPKRSVLFGGFNP